MQSTHYLEDRTIKRAKNRMGIEPGPLPRDFKVGLYKAN